ncbi:LuxR family transcriptional regulator [Actinacidiphila epipremni]|jgi:biotin operon repressor|uniref:LuxR family transcriptional regulator n=1 Tax=Actinacidiphila epipremni TaxID=2053013 RepID=A0ABX0ZN63_9ACTN|nr:LuxR family transcriptional regulator [Actinacidiphila epipremni]NJP45280.1 LuxR family transcriptional regulator [Actinacidiphila epipremni]
MSAGTTPAPESPASAEANLPQSLLRIADALGSLRRFATETAVQLVLTEGGSAPDPGADAHGGIRHIEGPDAVQDAIRDVMWGARRELCTAQPDGRCPAASMEEAYATVRVPLGRGVALRTLFQHSARFSEPTKTYVRQVQAGGGEVRTLPEFFDRLIIVDGDTALIPGDEDGHTAALVRDRAVVAFLRDVYERAWVRAEGFPFRPVRAADAAQDVVPDVRRAIMALLIEGRSDKAIARRLGMSLRSVQGHVATLREQYGAQHRFQLGYRLARSEYAAASRGPADPGLSPPCGPSADTRASGWSASGRRRP